MKITDPVIAARVAAHYISSFPLRIGPRAEDQLRALITAIKIDLAVQNVVGDQWPAMRAELNTLARAFLDGDEPDWDTLLPDQIDVENVVPIMWAVNDTLIGEAKGRDTDVAEIMQRAAHTMAEFYEPRVPGLMRTYGDFVIGQAVQELEEINPSRPAKPGTLEIEI